MEDKKEYLALDTSTNKLINDIIAEESPTKLKDLTYLFKVHVAKKNIIRLIKYYDMMDLVNDQTMQRLENRPDEISNKDLITFMTTFLTTIEKTTQSLGTLDDTTPGLVINQQNNEVNINVGTQKLDRDSKERVVDAIKSLMSLISEPSAKNDVIDIEDIEDEEAEVVEEIKK
jgi:tRNA A37 threonylcarbamoyladenosine modification protein TsaB